MLATVRILESKNSKEDKTSLLKFVSDSTPDQVKALTLKGKMLPQTKELSESVNIEQVNDILEKALQEVLGKIKTLKKSYMTQAGAGGGLNPVWLLYRTIRAQFQKCTKKCGTYELNTTRRQQCLAQCKAASAQGKLRADQKAKQLKARS